MTIKEQIQKDLVQAFKDHNTVAKIAIGELKAAIIEAEKSVNAVELDDKGIIKILTKIIKNHESSASFCMVNGRPDIAEKDNAEMEVLRKYMPIGMTPQQIESALISIYGEFSNISNEQARKGKTIGEFNKRYNGLADVDVVKKLVSTF